MSKEPAERFSYTSRRLGTRTADGVIARCPSCGRAGAYQAEGAMIDGTPRPARYLHGGSICAPAPLAARALDDVCSQPLSEEAQARYAALQAAREARQQARAARGQKRP